MLISALANAYIFGSMASLAQQMNQKAVKFQAELDTANTAMNSLKLPLPLRNEVIEYLKSTYQNKDQQEEVKEFYEGLPVPRQEKITLNIMFVSLCDNRTLMEHLNPDTPAFMALVNAVRLEFCAPGMEIIFQGDQVKETDCLYFIERGECEVYNKDSLKTESQYGKKIRVLYQSDFFGVKFSHL